MDFSGLVGLGNLFSMVTRKKGRNTVFPRAETVKTRRKLNTLYSVLANVLIEIVYKVGMSSAMVA